MLKLLGVAAFVAVFWAWGTNINKFLECDFESPYKCEIVRGLSSIPMAPVGVVIGFMDFEFDGK